MQKTGLLPPNRMARLHFFGTKTRDAWQPGSLQLSIRPHSVIPSDIGSDRCSLNPPRCRDFSLLSLHTPDPGPPAATGFSGAAGELQRGWISVFSPRTRLHIQKK